MFVVLRLRSQDASHGSSHIIKLLWQRPTSRERSRGTTAKPDALVSGPTPRERSRGTTAKPDALVSGAAARGAAGLAAGDAIASVIHRRMNSRGHYGLSYFSINLLRTTARLLSPGRYRRATQ